MAEGRSCWLLLAVGWWKSEKEIEVPGRLVFLAPSWLEPRCQGICGEILRGPEKYKRAAHLALLFSSPSSVEVMNNNQGSSVFDGLLSVDLISVGFVPFPALLIETVLFFLRPLALRAIWWEEGGTFIQLTQCTFFCMEMKMKMKMKMAMGIEAAEAAAIPFLSVSRQINHFFPTNNGLSAL